MAGPKSTRTGIITFTIHPYACFLSSYYADKLTSNTTIITTVELLIMDPPRSGHSLYNGQLLWNRLSLVHYEPPRSGQPPNSL